MNNKKMAPQKLLMASLKKKKVINGYRGAKFHRQDPTRNG